MSIRPTTYFKLGLLTVFAMVSVIAAALALGLSSHHSLRISYHTYFDESVQGLDIDSPVTYRGVRIGKLSNIEIASDRRHVDVTLALDARDVERLQLAQATPIVRAQLGSRGLTGIKFVEIDYFDPATSPLPVLGFTPATNYIPAKVSLFKGLADNLEIVVQRLPSLIDGINTAMLRLDGLLDDVREQHLPARVAETIGHVNRSILAVHDLVRGVDRARLPDRASAVMDKLTSSLSGVSDVVDHIGGDHGLVASARRATDAIGDFGRQSSTLELDRTLHDLDAAAQAIRDLVDSIERDPDMLVKGRARMHER